MIIILHKRCLWCLWQIWSLMKTPKCYTWLESCGSHLSGGVKKKIYFCILQRVRFSRTLRTDIFLYTEKLSKAMRLWMVIDHWSIQRKRQHWSVEFAMHTKPWRRPTSIMVCTANWTKLLGLSTARMQVWEHTVEKSQTSATTDTSTLRKHLYNALHRE